jgi:hypothetical protein
MTSIDCGSSRNKVKLTHSLYFAASALPLTASALPPPLPLTAASVSALFIGISDKRFSIKNNNHYTPLLFCHLPVGGIHN